MVEILHAINEKKDTRRYYHGLMRYIDDFSVENWKILLRNDFENAWCVLKSYDWGGLYDNDGWFHVHREAVLIDSSKLEHTRGNLLIPRLYKNKKVQIRVTSI